MIRNAPVSLGSKLNREAARETLRHGPMSAFLGSGTARSGSLSKALAPFIYAIF